MKSSNTSKLLFTQRKQNVSNSLFKSSRPDPGQREKTNLNFYFHKFLWCLKRFHEGLIDVNFHFNTIFWNARGGKG